MMTYNQGEIHGLQEMHGSSTTFGHPKPLKRLPFAYILWNYFFPIFSNVQTVPPRQKISTICLKKNIKLKFNKNDEHHPCRILIT